MRIKTAIVFGISALLLLGHAGLAQQGGGLKLMEPEAGGVCKDEAAGESAKQRELAILQDLQAMLKRMAELRKKTAGGPGPAEAGDIDRELARMREKTDRMLSELQGTTGGTGKNP